MLYFTPPSTLEVRDLITAGRLGMVATPRQGNRIEQGWEWFADNGCYGAGYPGLSGWLRWLTGRPYRDRCRFAVAPDVLGDARATLKASAPVLPAIRALGFRAAFVLQNGVTPGLVPYELVDVVFIGGDDEFKSSPAARRAVDEALERGLEAHWGRANGLGRLITAAGMGCTTADGNTLAMYPPTLEPMLRWLDDNRVQQRTLW